MDKVQVVALAATRESVLVLIAVCAPEMPSNAMALSVGDQSKQIGSDWHGYESERSNVWYQKVRVGGLQPGTRYDLELHDGANGSIASAKSWTLMPPDSKSFAVVVGSCFDIESEVAGRLAEAYDDAVKPIGVPDTPVYNLWSGDQVYVDAPWQNGWKPSDARGVILDNYINTWGLSPEPSASGLSYAMRESSNWYLPDDHEFWNGYPHPSMLTLPFHTAGRVLTQTWRRVRPEAPRYPHPFSQGRWGRAAGEAYCVFQSDRDFDVFDESVSPEQIQKIETDSAVVALVDSRWFRTIRKTGSRAGFMRDGDPEDDLTKLTTLLTGDERFVCLVLSRPLIGHLPHRGLIRDKVEYSPEDYSDQYTKLWEALLARAESGLPTLVVGGDVHRHSVRTALDDRLLEVVSSPLARLKSLDEESPLSRVSTVWANVKGRGRSAWLRVGGSGQPDKDPLAYPIVNPDGSWESGSGSALFEGNEYDSGIVSLTFDLTEPTAPQVSFRSVIVPNGKDTELDVTTRLFGWDGAWVDQTGEGGR